MRAAVAAIAAGLFVGLAPAAAASWRPVGELTPPRADHTATELADGRVLVTGGNTGVVAATPSAQLYDPGFDPLSQRVRGLSARRMSSRSVRLRFVPPSPWRAARPMRQARGGHSATLLGDGRVLIAGGAGSNGTRVASAEIYDPERDRWTGVTPLGQARSFHTATALPDGRVLVVGGYGADGGAISSAEVYDPRSGTWTTVAPTATPHANHTATLLADGRVLVAGGDSERVPGRNPEFLPTAAAEVFDPASGTWSSPACPAPPPAPEQPSPCLHVARSLHTAVALPGGAVLVAGGVDATDEAGDAPRRSAELYDPAAGTWATTASMGSRRAEHSAALLADGSVFVAGGRSDNPASAELFAPSGPRWTFADQMDVARRAHTATLLGARGCRPHCGEVLVAGGRADAFGSQTPPRPLGDPQLFRPAGSPSARRGAPAERYVVKQSRTPIRDARAFARAQSLCRRACVFRAARRSAVTLTVTRLRPGTTYYYAVQAVNGRRRGPISSTARVTTRR